jgi:threonine/homoserine/homoserine lactone efflux protein
VSHALQDYVEWKRLAAAKSYFQTTVARLFLTTLLNPKALIFAFVIFPHTGLTTLTPYDAIFAALVAIIGASWILLGGLIASSAFGTATPRRISRIAAVALGVFATLIASSAVAAFS